MFCVCVCVPIHTALNMIACEECLTFSYETHTSEISQLLLATVLLLRKTENKGQFRYRLHFSKHKEKSRDGLSICLKPMATLLYPINYLKTILKSLGFTVREKKIAF